MMRLIRCAPSSTPRPAPSTPQLLETTVRSPAPWSSSASISTHGMPHSPNPPTASVAPRGTSATAWAASGTTLSMQVTVEHRPAAPPATDRRRRAPACDTAGMTSAVPAPVVLVGFMGAGKSTVGRLVARRLGVGFADSDDVITQRTGRTPRDIFATDGESAFRALERAVVRDLVGDRPAEAPVERSVGVLALGGGAVEDAGTREVLRAARVVHLEVSFEQVRARVGRDPGRPVLARPDLPEIFAARQAAYREVADVVLPTDGLAPAAVADRAGPPRRRPPRRSDPRHRPVPFTSRASVAVPIPSVPSRSHRRPGPVVVPVPVRPGRTEGCQQTRDEGGDQARGGGCATVRTGSRQVGAGGADAPEGTLSGVPEAEGDDVRSVRPGGIGQRGVRRRPVPARRPAVA